MRIFHAIARNTLCAIAGIATFVSAPTSIAQERGAEKVEEYFQELFLGESVYPQDRGELQVSVGYFWRERDDDTSTLPVLLEYGLTDYLQVGVTLPTQFDHGGDAADGLGNVAFEVYWSFLNSAETGWASGVGFEYFLPEATPEAGEDAHAYETFGVLYKDFGGHALNFSAAVEVEDPREDDEEAETSGDLAAAYIRQSAGFPLLWLLEAGVEIESDETPVGIAPGAYFSPDDADWELGFSLPIGLNDAPDVAAFVLFTMEFGGEDDAPAAQRRGSRPR